MSNDRFGILDFQQGISVHEIDCDNLVDADKKINFYKPLNEYKFEELKDSIKEHGVLHPLIVWEMDNGKYTILSGHNRKKAYDALATETEDKKYKKIHCRVFRKHELDESKAQEIIIDTNWVQRELSLLERVASIAIKYEFEKKKPAFAYKDSVSKICNQYKLKERQLMYYKKLGQLKEELLHMVDNGKISIKSGSKLAGFSKELQNLIYELHKDDIKNHNIMQLDESMNIEQITEILGNNNDDFIKILINIPKSLADEFNIIYQEFIEKNKDKFDAI